MKSSNLEIADGYAKEGRERGGGIQVDSLIVIPVLVKPDEGLVGCRWSEVDGAMLRQGKGLDGTRRPVWRAALTA